MVRPRRRVAAVRRRAQPAHVLAEVEGHLARAAPQRAGADPDHLAAGAELVEPGGRPAAEPAGKDVALPGVGGEGDALERDEYLAQPVDARAAGRRGIDAMPRRQEAGELLLLNGLDLLAQRRERRAPQPAEHVGVAPLALAPAGTKLPANESAVPLELAQHRPGVDAVPRRESPVVNGPWVRA